MTYQGRNHSSDQPKLLTDEELIEKIGAYSEDRDEASLFDLVKSQQKAFAAYVIGQNSTSTVMSPSIKLDPTGRIDNTWTGEHEQLKQAHIEDTLRMQQRKRAGL